MKKIIIPLIFIFIFLILFFFFQRKNTSNKSVIFYTLNEKKYKLLTAKNPQEWEKGLMFYRKPLDFDGIIFLFPDKKFRSFWNKNTYLDLDVYWIADDRIVGKDYLPSIIKTKEIFTINSKEKVNKVIELVIR